ncbi:hypothetical protein GQX74_010534 [Glossina fuscipes]|nr:hypothetical protein GQX74_010534 [Glossina fuscipes]
MKSWEGKGLIVCRMRDGVKFELFDRQRLLFKASCLLRVHYLKKEIEVFLPFFNLSQPYTQTTMYRVITATTTCGLSHFILSVSSKKTTLKLIWCTLAICCLNQQISSTGIKDERNVQVQEFIDYMESLVLNTTNKALMKTRNIFQNFSQQIDANLTVAVETLISDYITKVNEALKYNYNYTEKRKLLQLFRHEGQEMEKLRSLHNLEKSEFRVQLISKEFINESRNLTDFDNLYLKFMQEFQNASGVLTAALINAKEKEENYFELLTLLGDIKNERNLKEKDKLYDEFIETFLFKSEQDRVETRDLS